jgi:histone H3/H4
VSADAMDEFAKVMEERMFKIAVEAAMLAKHAGRKTIMDDDVRKAMRKF